MTPEQMARDQFPKRGRPLKEVRREVAETIAKSLQKKIDKGKLPGWQVALIDNAVSVTLDEVNGYDPKTRVWVQVTIPTG